MCPSGPRNLPANNSADKKHVATQSQSLLFLMSFRAGKQGSQHASMVTVSPVQQQKQENPTPMTPGFIAILVVCQLAGEALARIARIPVPGPVLGMVLLFSGLLVRGFLLRRGGLADPPPEGLQSTANALLRHLGLLFIPAGVGVVTLAPLLALEWKGITLAVVGSTFLGLIVTGHVMQAMTPRTRFSAEPHGGPESGHDVQEQPPS